MIRLNGELFVIASDDGDCTWSGHSGEAVGSTSALDAGDEHTHGGIDIAVALCVLQVSSLWREEGLILLRIEHHCDIEPNLKTTTMHLRGPLRGICLTDKC